MSSKNLIICVCIAATLSGCSFNQSSSTTDFENVEFQIPNIPEKALLGDYDQNIIYRLTDMMLCLDLEIDEDRMSYQYLTLEPGGPYGYQDWDIESEESDDIWNPPGTENKYLVRQFDKNGKIVMDTEKTVTPSGITATQITLYDRTRTGTLKAAFTYSYNDYEWEYLLDYLDVYYEDKVVSKTTFDKFTGKRATIRIFAAGGQLDAGGSPLLIKSITCDEEGNPLTYAIHEYNDSMHENRVTYYDLNDNLKNYTLYLYDEYDENRIVKLSTFDADDRLLKETIFNENGSQSQVYY